MFDLQYSLESYLAELKSEKKVTLKRKNKIKKSLTQAGILDKDGNLKKIKIG
ncbi:MAG: hypothetical protein AABZ74_11620 [Cyanobacteriota bacterium]